MEDLVLTAQSLVRIYCDISRDAEMKMRMRCIQLQEQDGRKYTRKQYLEKLILDDISKVKGASFSEVKRRKQAGYSYFVVIMGIVALAFAMVYFLSANEVANIDQRCVSAGGVPVHLPSGTLCLSPDAIKKPASQ